MPLENNMPNNDNSFGDSGGGSKNFDKFTKEAKQALVEAQNAAKRSQTDYVGTEHLLIGILSQGNSLGASILTNFGVSLENVNLVLKTVGRVTPSRPSNQPIEAQNILLSGFAKQVIENAVRVAHDFNHMYIGTEHLLYALVSQENTAATVILENMKVNVNDLKQEVLKLFEGSKRNSNKTAPQNPMMMNPLEFLLSGLHGVLAANDKNVDFRDGFKHKQGDPNAPTKSSTTPALDFFTYDLVKEFREKKKDPIIGREKEIERMISILQRKTKNNPVLIGESGVGKTAVVEGLAQAIATEKVPDDMLDYKILSLSMTSVVAGTKYRGEFEERIKQILDEAATQSNIILFIDELHTVIGAGSAEGSLDAANILKPALSRGKVQVIGATTTNEYRKHIENDAALERRFQSVMINEPSIEDTITIITGLREAFEIHHNLNISDEAIVEAVRLSKRYLPDRFLPDKAIDLVDEAAAVKGIKLKMSSDLKDVKKHQQELNKIIKKKEEAVSQQDYEFAAELRSKELELINKIDEAKKVKIPVDKRETINKDDIAFVVSRITGVPVTRLLKSDTDKLLNLEKILASRIIGQKEALKIVSQAIRRSRAGVADSKRPIGSFIFLGPTGVGKTELVKTLAAEIYDDENALIKIDMSEFMEKHNTSRLVGTTAGYVGYDDGGQLTEAIRRKPYSVVLFDEIEKAHPDVFNLLLQILEDGQLTDSKGRKVDFRNTIVVMTSNIGAELLTKSAGPVGFSLKTEELNQAMQNYEDKKSNVLEELKNHFRPEFLNRVDKIVVFEALTNNDIKEIVKLHLQYLENRLETKKLMIEPTKAALDYLAEVSFDPDYGARPVRRKIQELVEDPLTEALIISKFKDGDKIKLGKGKDGIVLEKSKK